ncbi:MAG TPA: tRNA dimethylallyltransferase, partial [Sphingobacteriaceae bacterium]|nr:tRNA dimethylallyltransferase [Sphingobacteriaceae bacterium]
KKKTSSRKFETLLIGLDMDRETLYERINHRVDQMMADGLLAEVQRLWAHRELPTLKTVGYAELFEHLDGQITLEEAVEKIKQNTRRYAKRQLTWFRKDPEIRWFHPHDIEQIITYIRSDSPSA